MYGNGEYKSHYGDYNQGLTDSELISQVSNKLTLICAYYIACARLTLQKCFDKLESYSGINDLDLYEAYLLQEELTGVLLNFDNSLADFSKNTVDEDFTLGENTRVETVKFESFSYSELFQAWEKWFYDSYIFYPLKKIVNDKIDVLSNLNKRINEKDGHKWLKNKIGIDYRQWNANDIQKKVLTRSKHVAFNAFKVLSTFNFFAFIGSFLIEYLVHSDDVDEIFNAYKEGYKEGTEGRDKIDTLLASVNQTASEVISYLCENYKHFFLSGEIDEKLKENLRNQLNVTNKRLNEFFIRLNKFGDRSQHLPIYIRFLTNGNIINVNNLTLGLDPQKYIDYNEVFTKQNIRRWLVFNSNDEVYNRESFPFPSYPGPRDNDYLGPISVSDYNIVAEYCKGMYWKEFLGSRYFGITQIYGELYRLGIWNYTLNSILKEKLLKVINSVEKEKHAFSFDTAIKVKANLELQINSEFFVNPEITKNYLKLIGLKRNDDIQSIIISSVTFRVNQETEMSSPHSALYRIEYDVLFKSSKESISYKNTRNIFDNVL